MNSQSFRVKKGLEVGVGGTIITTTKDGNVGLGTTNPTSKLQVSGNIKTDNLNTLGIGTIETLVVTTGTITNLNTTGIATITNLRVGIGYTVLPFSDAIGYGLNVREFGATGNGVTDDRTFIQAGINSARTTGKPLIFPPGQYRLGTRGLDISGDVKLIGAGGTITWGVQDPSFALGPIISLSGLNSNIIIDGLKFESNDNNQDFNSWFNGGSLGRFELRNCEFRSGAGTTVPYLMQTQDGDIEETKLTNCYFFNTKNIWRSNYSTGTHKSVTIEGCTFDESPVIGMNSPSGYVRGVNIIGNQIKNISSPIQSDGGDYVNIVGNVFENVDVVYLPEQFAKRVVISDNMCVEVGQLIKGWSQSGNFVITNNAITGRKLRFNQRFGVNIGDATVGTAVTVPWNVNSYPGELKVYRSTPLDGGVDEYLMSPYSYTFTSSGSGTSGISTITFFGRSFSQTTFKVEQYLMEGSAVFADDYDSYNNGAQGGIIANNFIEGFDVAFDLEISRYTWTIENNRIRNCNVAFKIFGDGKYKTPVLGNNNTLSGVTTAVIGDSAIEIGKLNYEDVRDFYIDVPFSANNIPNFVNVNDWDTHIRGFRCSGISANRTLVSNRTGTLASSGVSTITGISTSSIVTGLVLSGDYVPSGIITAFGSTTQTPSNPSSTVVIGVGVNSITVNRPFTNVGIATTTFTFTSIEPNYILSADNQIQILPSLPYHMVGKLQVRTTETTTGRSQFFGEYDIRYDGTTFIYQVLRKYGTGAYNAGVNFTPNFTGFADDLYISNGKLYFQAYNNEITSYAQIHFDFDGDLIYRASSNSKSFYGEKFVNFANTYSYNQTATGYTLATVPSSFDVTVTCDGQQGIVMLKLPPPVPGIKVTVINRSTSAWTSIRTFDTTNHKILGLIPGGKVSTSTFTATAGQDTFSTSYDVGYIDVYVDGARLASDEYTATNGTSIVLSIACSGGEKVDIRKVEKEQLRTNDYTIGIGQSSIAYNPDYANIQLLGVSYNRWQVISSFPQLTRDKTGWVFSTWDTV